MFKIDLKSAFGSISAENKTFLQIFDKLDDFAKNPPSCDSTFEIEKFNEIPTIDAMKMLLLKAAIHTNSSIKTALERAGFHYKYDRTVIQELLRSNAGAKRVSVQFAFITYFQAVAIVFNSTECLTPENLGDLINCLMFSISLPQFSEYQNYIFSLLLESVIVLPSFIWSNETIGLVYTYFTTNDQLSSRLFPLLVRFCEQAVEFEEDTWKDPSLTLFESLITSDRPIMHVDDFSPIFRFIKPYLEQLDSHSLSCLFCIARLCTIKSISMVFADFPQFLLDYLEQYPATIKVEKCDLIDEKLIGYYDEIPDFDYKFISKDFSNEFKTLPAVLDEIPETPIALFDKTLHIKVQCISEVLPQADKSCFNIFLSSFVDLLKKSQKSDYYYDLFTIFLSFVWIAPSDEFINDNYDFIFSKDIFNPRNLIFQRKTINRTYNILRSDILSHLNSNQYTCFIKTFKNRPILMSEYLARTVSFLDMINVQEVFTSEVLEIIIDSSLMLQNMQPETELIHDARNANFLFLFSLLKYKMAIQKFYSFPFVNKFFRFMFEKNISDSICEVFRISTLDINTKDNRFDCKELINEIDLVFSQCYDHIDEESYDLLALKLVNAIRFAVRFNFNLVISMGYLFETLMKYLLKKQSFEFLQHVLHIILNMSFSNGSFQLPKDYFSEFVQLLTRFKDNESIYNLLLRLLSVAPFKKQFIIQRPSFIPLIVCVYENDSKLFSYFLRLCQYSFYNCRSLHKGHLDMFLLDAIGETSTKYFNHVVSLKFSSEFIKSTIIPILYHILTNESSELVVNKIQSIIASHPSSDIFDMLISVLLYFNKNPKIIPIGAIKPYQQLQKKIPFSEISSGFTINFELLFDKKYIRSFDEKIIIFSISSKDHSFTLYLDCSHITANFAIGEHHIAIRICDLYNVNDWTRFLVTYNVDENKEATINSYFNHEFFGETPFYLMNYPKSNVKLNIGGFNGSSTWNGSIFAFISNFQLVNKAGETILNTSNAPTNFQYSIGDYISKTSLLKTLADFPQYTINSLALFFDYSPSTGTPYKWLDNYISKIKQMNITYSTYHAIYTGFSHLKSFSNKQEMFEKIVINLTFWKNASKFDFRRILNHLSTIVIIREREFFEKKSYFNKLQQFYFPEDLDESLRKQVLLFIERVSCVNIAYEDALRLLSWCDNLEENGIVKLLELLTRLSKHIEIKADDLKFLHNKVDEVTNIDLLSKLIIAIEEISGSNVHQSCMTLIFQLDKKEKEFLESLFNSLVKEINQFPNLFSLLSFLAIKLDSSVRSSFSNTLAELVQQPDIGNRVFLSRAWYIWPLMLCIVSEKEDLKRMCEFLAFLSVKSTELESIVVMISLLNALNTESSVDLNYIFIDSVIQTSQLRKQFLDTCFQSIFFHFFSRTHSRALVDLFKKSPFEYEEEREKPKKHIVLATLQQLIDFANTDFSQYIYRFELRVDNKGNLIDTNLIALALQIAKKMQLENDETKILRYFHPSLLKPSEKLEIWKDIGPIIDNIVVGIMKQFNIAIESFCSEIRSLVSGSTRLLALQCTKTPPHMSPRLSFDEKMTI